MGEIHQHIKDKMNHRVIIELINVSKEISNKGEIVEIL